MATELERILSFCRQGGRICPLPLRWNDLYELLPNKRRRGSGWEPSLPLILAAWHETTDEQKRQRLEEHLRWAEEHSVLEDAAAFLRGLAEDEWLHAAEYPSNP